MLIKHTGPKSQKLNIVAGYQWHGSTVVPIGLKIITALSNKSPSESVIVPPEREIVLAAGEKMSKYHGEIVRNGEGSVDLAAEMTKHPDALWIRVKAIEADRENDNGDYFSEEEILKSYKTFEGCPVFTNHENNKVENAKGKVITAEWHPGEKAVYCTMFIDRKAHPGLCRAIEEGYVTDVSMGTQVDFSTCSVCAQKAYTADDYCFLSGTQVLMADFSVRNIEEIKIGDRVIDAYGVPTTVTKTFKHDVSENIQAITSRLIDGTLLATGNHPFLCERRGEHRFVHAHDMDDNETLSCPVYAGPETEEVFEGLGFEKTEENKSLFSRLIGYYAAEGCVSRQNGGLYSVEFSFDASEKSFIDDVKDICSKLFGVDASVFHYPQRSNGASIRVYLPMLAEFFSKYVPGVKKEKKMSAAVVTLPLRYLREVISGYCNGDGCTKNGEKLVINTGSRDLASQMVHAMLRLGSSPSVYSYMQAGGPTSRDKQFSTHRVTVSGSQLIPLANCGEKLARFANLRNKKQEKLKNVFTADGLFSRHNAYEIVESHYSGPVYNIETESHTYVANNTATHNCDHVKTMKGRNVNGTKIFEKNYGLKFIEISVVTDGACKDCTIREIIDPQDFVQQQVPMMSRAADALSDFVKVNAPISHEHSDENGLPVAQDRICSDLESVAQIYQGLLKTALMTKDSGQAEIQKLNQAMDLLEDVSRTMLDQRQYIDLEFLSKLVDVFADLQKVNDELVDQGYASVGGGSPQQAAAMPAPQSGKEQPMQGANEVSTGPSAGGVGKITEPATASVAERKTILSGKIEEVATTAKKILEEAKLSRGGNEVSANKFEETKSKIASVWKSPSIKKFQTEISEGDWKIVIGREEVFGLLGTTKVASIKRTELDADIEERLKADPQSTGEQMLDALKNKYANVKVAESAPVDGKSQLTQTMEAQLREQNPPLHPRENKVRDSITEEQLNEKSPNNDWNKRQEEARTATTEHQLHKEDHHGYEENQKPQDKPRTATPEKQLRDTSIMGNQTPADGGPWAAGVSDQTSQIHEGQLQDWLGADKPVHPDSITEKQLREQGDPLGRRIAASDAKVILASGMKALIRTAMATGATPEELIETINLFTLSPKNQMCAANHASKLASVKEAKDTRSAMLRRASFHGVNALSVATANDISNYLLGTLSDVGLAPEVGVSTLKVLASQKDAGKKFADAITAGLEQEAAKAPAAVSIEDMLKEALASGDKEESLTIVLAEKEVGEHATEEAFAKAAYDAATKLAAAQGFKVTANVHVAKKKGTVEVEMKGVKEEAKEAVASVAAPAVAEDTKTVEARKEERKKMVEAQMPGGEAGAGGAGAAPGGAGGGTTMPTPGMADPTAGTPPVSALGEGGAPPEGEEGGESDGQALPPGSTCPACGSDDVDVRGGDIDCNNCGMTGHIKVQLEVDNWPGSLEDKGSGAKADEAGMAGGMDAGMEGGMPEAGGTEMPPVGLQAAFKVTPEMIKIAGGKPIGSFCPHCSSPKVKLASKSGSAIGKCENCSGTYTVEAYVDAANLGELWATIHWQDQGVKKLASKAQPMSKKAQLSSALRAKGLEAKFAKSDLEGKGDIIALLHQEGLLK